MLDESQTIFGGAYFMSKYTKEFKLKLVKEYLKWEQIYYEEGPQSLFSEKRGRKSKMSSKPNKKKISKATEKDLIEEVQYLRMENAYSKKLHALIQERDNPQKKKK